MINKRKAYFVAPLFAKEYSGNVFTKISEILKKNKFEVFDDVNKVTAEQARAMTYQEISKYFTRVESLIRQTDVFVTEMTEASASIGYEIGYAIANEKPVLILRHENKTNGSLGAPFRANKNKITTLLYNDHNLEEQIKKFLKKADKGIFMKRLPIEFTREQIEFVEKIKKDHNLRSFNAAVRHIIDTSIEKE